jgi:ubiquinol-cytochrome c reductase cytochrome b subunit
VWLVLRHGVSEPPKPGKPVNPKTYQKEYETLLQKTGVPFWPVAAWRDVVFCVAMLGVMAVLAWMWGAPQLGGPPDPSVIAANPRPDWYLLWYFAVLALLPHGTENYFIVLGPLFVGTSLLALPFVSNRGERSLRRRPWAVAIVLTTVVMIATLWIQGAKSPWSPNFDAPPLPISIIGTSEGPIFKGAQLFHSKSCLRCHLIDDQGGRRGPNLTDVGDRLSKEQMILRISNGGVNMPAFAGNLKPTDMDDLVAFLQSRKTNKTEK